MAILKVLGLRDSFPTYIPPPFCFAIYHILINVNPFIQICRLNFKSRHPQIGDFNSEDIDEFIIAPASDFGNGFANGRDTQLSGFSGIGVVDTELGVVDRDSSVRVDGAFELQAEDVFVISKRGRYLKRSE